MLGQKKVKEKGRGTTVPLNKHVENKAVYTTTPVAGGWAGAVMIWAGAIMIWARHAQIQTFQPLKCPKMQEKNAMKVRESFEFLSLGTVTRAFV